MIPITVAVADADTQRRLKLEQILQGNREIRVLTNTESSGMGVTRNRRRSSRADLTVAQHLVARTRRLSPSVLLLNLNHCADGEGCILSLLRQACPQTRVVVLADDVGAHETQIMSALANGARGYLELGSDPILISKAVKTISEGGAWIPRKMLGTMMDQLSSWKRPDTE